MNLINKKNLLLVLFVIILNLSCETTQNKDSNGKEQVYKKLAQKLAQTAKQLKKKTVAVYGFEMIGRKDDIYSQYATEKLTHELVDTGKLLVIERSRIKKLMQEHELVMSGVVNADFAAKIGKILAVEAVIIGSIKVDKNEVEFLARAIQSETAIILKSANEKYKVISGAESSTKITSHNNETNLKNKQSQYRAFQKIVITYKDLPGNKHDWITLVEAYRPDNYYGQWFYTNGKKSGKYIFRGVKPGDYEIRIFYNWPAGGYKVQQRMKIKVE